MKLNTSPFASALIGAALVVSACGDDSSNNNNNQNNSGGSSLQQEAFDNGQIDIIDGSGLVLDPATLAVTGIARATPTTALPAGFAAADYFGAVDPSATTPWWQGWTAIDSDFDGNLPGADFHPLQAEIEDGTLAPAATNECTGVSAEFADGGVVTIFGKTFPVCVISDDITTDVTLVASHVWVLDGTISVGDGAAQLMGSSPTLDVTLTVEAGAQIYAAGNDAASVAITRGSQIDAEGTADLPIIFASVEADFQATNVITGDPTDLSGRGQWGGVILSGNGIVNNGDTNGELGSEASPPSNQRFFGGSNNSDDSGTLKYAIIAETGFAFVTDSEVQGLTLEAAGSGTDIEFVQIIGSNDDCVEWFGGAADISHLVCVGVNDDALDIDSGYQGNIQFALIRMGATNGDHGIESDNNGSTFDLAPVSSPNIANITILGNAGREDTSTNGALHREGFAGKLYRSVFTDDTVAGGAFEAGCLDIDDVVPTELRHYDSVFNCTGGTPEGLTKADD